MVPVGSVGLQIWVHGRNGFICLVNLLEAKRIVRLFGEGNLPPIIGSHNVQTAEGMLWAVRTADITHLHTVDPRQLQVEQQQGNPGGFQWPPVNTSGG